MNLESCLAHAIAYLEGGRPIREVRWWLYHAKDFIARGEYL
jgi:hypothetical protein